MKRIIPMVLVLVVSVPAFSAWTTTYKRVTKERDNISVETQSDGAVRLCHEIECHILTPHEARELARIILTLVPDAEPRSFDELAEQAARDTDTIFCDKAKTDWERKAFCSGLRVPINLKDVPPYRGHGRRYANRVYMVVPFDNDSSAQRALDTMQEKAYSE